MALEDIIPLVEFCRKHPLHKTIDKRTFVWYNVRIGVFSASWADIHAGKATEALLRISKTIRWGEERQ